MDDDAFGCELLHQIVVAELFDRHVYVVLCRLIDTEHFGFPVEYLQQQFGVPTVPVLARFRHPVGDLELQPLDRLGMGLDDQLLVGVPLTELRLEDATDRLYVKTDRFGNVDLTVALTGQFDDPLASAVPVVPVGVL